MNTHLLRFFTLFIFGVCVLMPAYSITNQKDTTFSPYYVNYWVTGTICGVGILVNSTGISNVMHKKDLSQSEMAGINRGALNGFDSWALDLDPTQIKTYNSYSNTINTTLILLPALLLFDKNIRSDWLDILLMYTEVTFITSNFFNYSFLGPSYQSRFRPITYYNQLTYDERRTGNNRNSFYSGHVASAAAITFFMAKVYSDYNPEIGDNKYLLYAAALVPPLITGYCRVKSLNHFPSDVMVGLAIGALMGIVIPEFHRIQTDNVKVNLYSENESTGISVHWQTNFLK
jgi:membrane-associated phospholipid phosphatase